MTALVQRFPVAAPLAALVTFAIFFVMTVLIATGKSAFTEEVQGRVIDFVRVKQDFSIGAVSADVDVDVSAGMGAGASDGDYLPIVKVAPVYPQRALSRKIEGWVLVEFTVTETGAVADARAIEAEPPGIFEDAAVEAALKFRYKPRVIDGKPVAVSGVQNLIRFEMEK